MTYPPTPSCLADGIPSLHRIARRTIRCSWLVCMVAWCILLTVACQKVALPNEGTEGTTPSQSDELSNSTLPSEVPPVNISALLAQYAATGATLDVDVAATGYITGACKSASSACFSPSLLPGYGVSSNLMLADSPFETSTAACLHVELKSGSSIRQSLNLVDHPDMWGRRITVQGKVTRYFSIGIKGVTAFQVHPAEELQQPEIPEEPGESEDPDTPDVPDTPEGPGTSEDPDTPESPGLPESPDTPGEPDTPGPSVTGTDTIPVIHTPQVIEGIRTIHSSNP